MRSLNKTLNWVMAYLGVEAGEIFLREDDEQELHLALHRGDFDEAFSHWIASSSGRVLLAWWLRPARPW